MSDHLSSSDEDLEEILQLVKIPKSDNYFEEVLPQFSAEQYMEHFRLSPERVQELVHRFAESEFYNWQEGDSEKITALKCITVFLGFGANEAASYRDVSDRFNISKSSLFKIIRKVINFLSNLSPEVIMWPDNAERNEIEAYFRANNFPGVIGVIDGTHIKIDRPAEDPDSYLNRKHFYSIQAQVVCDHRRKIRDIFVGFPGSVHDSRVLRSSPLYESLPEKCSDTFYILGDSGYPCLRHLLTPFKDNGHLTRRERNFNYILSSNRYIIEHCFGILKQKFRQLYHIKLKDVTVIVHFIRDCAVLHNLSLEDGFMEREEIRVLQDDVEIVLYENDEPDRDDRDGMEVRNNVMNHLPFVI